MHRRRRSPGNGYGSNPIGMVISPENSGGGHKFYNPEYRRFHRSSGHSHLQPKPFHSPPPVVAATRRKADIFMDAGRLAAEYLFFQGILPQGTNTGKCQNSNFKGFQEFRDSGRSMQFPVDGQASAVAQLQDLESDVGLGRTRCSDEYRTAGCRNYAKEKRRGGCLRGCNSEWNCEYGRSGSWSDQHKGSPGIDGDHEHDLGNQEEQLVAKNDSISMEKSISKESGVAQESEAKEYESIATSSGANKDVQDETDGGEVECLKSIPKGEDEEVNDKDIPGDEETSKEVISEELPKNKSPEKLNLQSLCKFTNMPRKTLLVRGSRLSEEEKNSDAGTSQVSEVLFEDKAVDGSIGNVKDTRDPELEISTMGTLQVMNLVTRSLVLDESQKLNEKRGEKRVIQEINSNVDIKRAREQSVVADVMGRPTTEEKLIAVDDQHQGSTKNNPSTSEIGEGSYAQERQLFAGSFKICDLNLMEISDVNEACDKDPIFIYQPISHIKKEVGPVDVDFSICHSSISSQHAKPVDDSDRAIEVIHLDQDSAPEDREFNITERKRDAAFTGLDGFSANPVQNATDIPNNQQGYGLVISELLKNDFNGCSLAPEINPVGSMCLSNEAGPLGDDDSIYTSLGEVPFLSFMQTWEQQHSQEDSKPF